jgi:hypothetical protein
LQAHGFLWDIFTGIFEANKRRYPNSVRNNI